MAARDEGATYVKVPQLLEDKIISFVNSTVAAKELDELQGKVSFTPRTVVQLSALYNKLIQLGFPPVYVEAVLLNPTVRCMGSATQWLLRNVPVEDLPDALAPEWWLSSLARKALKDKEAKEGKQPAVLGGGTCNADFIKEELARLAEDRERCDDTEAADIGNVPTTSEEKAEKDVGGELDTPEEKEIAEKKDVVENVMRDPKADEAAPEREKAHVDPATPLDSWEDEDDEEETGKMEVGSRGPAEAEKDREEKAAKEEKPKKEKKEKKDKKEKKKETEKPAKDTRVGKEEVVDAKEGDDEGEGEGKDEEKEDEGQDDKGKKKKKGGNKKGPNLLKQQHLAKKAEQKDSHVNKAEERKKANEAIPVGKWDGKVPTVLLKEYLHKHKLGKAYFEDMRKRPEDGDMVRVSCVILNKDRVSGKQSREEYVDGKAWPDLGIAKEASATFAMYEMMKAKQIPMYRLLPPKYRDMWLAWEETEKQKEQERTANFASHRNTFIRKLASRDKALSLTAPKPLEIRPYKIAERHEEQEVADDWEEEDPDSVPAPQPAMPIDSEGGRIMKQRYEAATESAKGQRMTSRRQTLPIWSSRERIVDLLSKNQCIIVSGDTGCGKSTQLPQFILEDAIAHLRGASTRIYVTQPRRISAVSLAKQVAREVVAEDLVGYHIKGERKGGKETPLVFCTSGILLRFFQSDPTLREHGITHVIIDEVHERGLVTDAILIALRNVMSIRSDIKVVLMSATADTNRFAEYFRGSVTVTIPGRTFPITRYFLEDVIEITSYQRPYPPAPSVGSYRRSALTNLFRNSSYSTATREYLENVNESEINVHLIVSTMLYIINRFQDSDGAILVFLPGLYWMRELNRVMDKHDEFSNCRVCFLHSALNPSSEDSLIAFERPPEGMRKVVLATNIAETSVTIEDVVFVIDTGKVNEQRYDSKHKSLAETWISKASAIQRSGRAGRVQEGFYFAMYSSITYSQLEQTKKPEMLRCSLDDLCLGILAMLPGVSVSDYLSYALDRPSSEQIAASMEALREINAITDSNHLTPLGHHLATLPVDLQEGKMLVYGSLFKCPETCAIIVVGNSRKSMAMTKPENDIHEYSDHLRNVALYREWEASQRHNRRRNKFLSVFMDDINQLLTQMKAQGLSTEDDPSADILLKRLALCCGLSPNFVKAEQQGATLVYRTATGKVHLNSILQDVKRLPSPFLVYSSSGEKYSGKVVVTDCTSIPPMGVVTMCGKLTCDYAAKQATADGWAKFSLEPRTMAAIEGLRTMIDDYLIPSPAEPPNDDLTKRRATIMDLMIKLGSL